MFLRNRVTGQVHDVPDHLVYGFHEAQEVNGLGEPLGLPFLAALVPMLSSLVPSLLPAVGGLLKGGSAPAPAPPPTAPPVIMSPPPAPPVNYPPEPAPRHVAPDRRDSQSADEEPMPPKRANGVVPPMGPAPPGFIYRVKRRARRRVRRPLPVQVNGYGFPY